MKPLVTVVVTTYNRVALLREALASVAAQSYSHLEVLVCDDGSTEDLTGTLPDGRFRHLRLQHQGRPAPARNQGLAEARGELVAFLDDDDVWESDKLQTQVVTLENRPELAMVCSNATLFPGPSLPWKWWPFEHRPSLAQVMAENPVALSSTLIYSDALRILGGFDEDPELAGAEDFDLWLRLLARCPEAILVQPRPLIRYRVQNQSLSAGSELERVLKILDKHRTHYTEAVEEAEAGHRRREEMRVLREDLYAKGLLSSGFLLKAGPVRWDTWLVLGRYGLARALGSESS